MLFYERTEFVAAHALPKFAQLSCSNELQLQRYNNNEPNPQTPDRIQAQKSLLFAELLYHLTNCIDIVHTKKGARWRCPFIEW